MSRAITAEPITSQASSISTPRRAINLRAVKNSNDDL
jgi:hypothetical protein